MPWQMVSHCGFTEVQSIKSLLSVGSDEKSLVDEPDVAMDVIGGSATFEVGGSSAATSRTKRGGKRVKFNTNARPDKVGKSMFVTVRGGIGKRG
ncbi:hypothetical protein Tco_0443647, partial [Tanacetum coccineum]